MNIPIISLDDKYLANDLAFMTGIHALVRLPMLQKQRDAAAGLNTAGFIAGYRGSPLARYDIELARARKHLDSHNVQVWAGINEDLALTAVWGSQQAEAQGRGKYDGVFGIWYAKGPGVDRSGDALRHANLAGSSRYGGVLALLGDDHTCESSSTAHQSEFAMVDYQLPVLNPATVAEIVQYGLHGWAMSRFCGSWVAMKCIHDTVEASAVVDLSLAGVNIKSPTGFMLPVDGLNLRINDTPLEQENRQHTYKNRAAQAYIKANQLDRVVLVPDVARIGIVTTGKAHTDFIQSLDEVGLSLDALGHHGVGVYKVAMSWPLEPDRIREFCEGLDLVIVIEEKRSLIEYQLKELLYETTDAPQVVGKLDRNGSTLFPSTGALSSSLVGAALRRLLAARLHGAFSEEKPTSSLASSPVGLARLPHFCAGCPHNTSTQVPEGSRAMAGTGCNYMVQWMDRKTLGFTHMGADGASWIGEAPFSKDHHIFQNMGDGTYFHSGLLAIRATVAAGVNITFKILYNDAVAMTGGQPHDGILTVSGIASQLLAEGVSALTVVSDEPDKYETLPAGVNAHHRDELDAIQRRMREVTGTSIIVYDQTCAAEKRRRRKTNSFPDPDRRIFINEAVCEGCGDCGLQSNCVAILPSETKFGRKRVIDQSACNKDFSCVKGFCPSFVSVSGSKPRSKDSAVATAEAALPDPLLPQIGRGYSMVVTGIGGTGVVTISALLGMAARIEGRGCALLDMTGLAQKGGSVISHIRFLPSPASVAANRIAPGEADAIIGTDLLVTVNGALEVARFGHTRAVMNVAQVLPGEFTRNRDLKFPLSECQDRLARHIGSDRIAYVDATRIASEIFADAIFANLIMLGVAYQQGLIPVSASSITNAIELNGVAIKKSKLAFDYGRRMIADPSFGLLTPDPKAMDEMTCNEIIEHRTAHLRAYQNTAYASQYRKLVGRIAIAEQKIMGTQDLLTRQVAISLAKLMSYKDEYEVARLYLAPEFRKSLKRQFDGITNVKIHLAPPIFTKTDPRTGRPEKRAFGPWVFRVFDFLAKMRAVRGTVFDPFGYSVERKQERAILKEYKGWLDQVAESLNATTYQEVIAIAALPQGVRGFGPVKMAAIKQYRNEREQLFAGKPAVPIEMGE